VLLSVRAVCRCCSKLKVGYYIDDGFVPASPACARAVLEAVEALRKDGHTVVEFKPPRSVAGRTAPECEEGQGTRSIAAFSIVRPVLLTVVF
jgi:Asp-tRNA(Asn)/Glu-tRNA(Gln) amidotransferase A subunit family amidase